MEIDTKRLTPGMILSEDVIGKSGKPIVGKDIELTDVHIEFIQKFLVEKVSITPLSNRKRSEGQKKNNDLRVHHQKDQLFINDIEKVVTRYEKLYTTWENNVPIDMYDVRKTFVPLFEKVTRQPLQTIMNSIPNKRRIDLFYYKNVAISLLAIFLANKLSYEKKDWLQIGFAAILSDVGMIRVDDPHSPTTSTDIKMHPIHSYRMVENITTLTQQAKMAILQHHERLDGSGYPANAKRNKIHPYARIIAISDFFFNHYENDIEEIVVLLKEQSGKLEDKYINKLISLLNE